MIGNPNMANKTKFCVRAVMEDNNVNKFENPIEPKIIVNKNQPLSSILSLKNKNKKA